MTAPIKEIARRIRKHVVKMHRVGPNVASSMSIADILAVLYFDAMRIDSPEDPDRDRFILSKGHAVSALYSVLAQKGFFDEKLLEQYLADQSPLTGHPVAGSVPGVEVSTGSLGHGLPIGAGLALAAKKDKRKHRIFVLMGDGECQEGSVWEGAMIAARLQLDNLAVIIDANNLQGYGRTDPILPGSSLKGIWESFGWAARRTDGHDVEGLKTLFSSLPFVKNRPSVIIAETIKGKGIAEMEDRMEWHYYSVPENKSAAFLAELDESK